MDHRLVANFSGGEQFIARHDRLMTVAWMAAAERANGEPLRAYGFCQEGDPIKDAIAKAKKIAESLGGENARAELSTALPCRMEPELETKRQGGPQAIKDN